MFNSIGWRLAGLWLTTSLLGLSPPAQASPVTFFGVDLGLGETTRLASHPKADAARDAFRANLQPGTAVETFESMPATLPPVFADQTLALGFAGMGTTLQGRGLVMNSPAPSTVNPVNGIPSGVYPISGLQAWLSSDDFEVRFGLPQVAFGFYGVDIGDFDGQLVLDLVHEDGTTTQILASNGVRSAGGSVQYFGVLSIDRPFTAVRFGNTAPVGYDGFVFDDLTIGTRAQLAEVPEPGTLALVLPALMLAAARLRRPRRG
jgi:hypothetical protein